MMVLRGTRSDGFGGQNEELHAMNLMASLSCKPHGVRDVEKLIGDAVG